VEFINFSRKAAPQAMTPSKPRSGVLNYMLNDLIPVGTLNHAEDTTFRKRFSTSNWAIAAIVALCSKTGEKALDRRRESSDGEDEPDLLFVRKFVLEHALKAYKDASLSHEALDARYARMLSLSDLFNRMLTGRPISGGNSATSEMIYASQKQLARIMFEKNYISALTSSIADIDLNFPSAKRAVKYILRPLKQLTQTALELSECSSLPIKPGQADADEISSASSVSDDLEDEREETPDLFRNSTLAMFDPGREPESSSGSSDGECLRPLLPSSKLSTDHD
jgi:E3 ubiquitin-protein ligase HUWE1